MECIICQAPSKVLYQNLSDRVHTQVSGEYALQQCQACSLLFIYPPPSEEKLQEHYPEDYHVYERKPSKVSARKASIIKLVARHCLGYGKSNPLMRFCLLPLYYKLIHLPNYRQRGRLLDIGCGTGTRLPTFELLGWESEGLEISQKAANIGQQEGYKIHNGTLDTFDAPKNHYDAIYLNNVFEHFLDPKSSLDKISALLKPGGQLSLVVPNANSLTFKLFKKDWFGLEVPRHLFTYNKNNLSQLLKSKGYSVTKVKYCYNFGSFSSSLALRLNKPLEKFAFIDRLTWLMAFLLDPIMNIFGIGDWMTIHASVNKSE